MSANYDVNTLTQLIRDCHRRIATLQARKKSNAMHTISGIPSSFGGAAADARLNVEIEQLKEQLVHYEKMLSREPKIDTENTCLCEGTLRDIESFLETCKHSCTQEVLDGTLLRLLLIKEGKK